MVKSQAGRKTKDKQQIKLHPSIKKLFVKIESSKKDETPF